MYSTKTKNMRTRRAVASPIAGKRIPPRDPGIVVDVHREERILSSLGIAAVAGATGTNHVLPELWPRLDRPRFRRELVRGRRHDPQRRPAPCKVVDGVFAPVSAASNVLYSPVPGERLSRRHNQSLSTHPGVARNAQSGIRHARKRKTAEKYRNTTSRKTYVTVVFPLRRHQTPP